MGRACSGWTAAHLLAALGHCALMAAAVALRVVTLVHGQPELREGDDGDDDDAWQVDEDDKGKFWMSVGKNHREDVQELWLRNEEFQIIVIAFAAATALTLLLLALAVGLLSWSSSPSSLGANRRRHAVLPADPALSRALRRAAIVVSCVAASLAALVDLVLVVIAALASRHWLPWAAAAATAGIAFITALLVIFVDAQRIRGGWARDHHHHAHAPLTARPPHQQQRRDLEKAERRGGEGGVDEEDMSLVANARH